MGYIVAIANEKGGVAKTTTAVSLAGALAELEQKVLAVDLDAQANLTLALGVDPTSVRHSIFHVLMQSATPHSARQETGIPGLDLIPATAEMGMAERFLPVRQDYQRLLQHALDSMAVYDFVLLDCPPLLGAVTMNALTAAQLLIIPTQAEYFSVYGLRSIIAIMKRVREQTNPRLAYRILITLLDPENQVHRTLREQLQSRFSDRVFDTVIEVDTSLRESPIAGMPVTHYISQSLSADQHRALALEVIRLARLRDPDAG